MNYAGILSPQGGSGQTYRDPCASAELWGELRTIRASTTVNARPALARSRRRAGHSTEVFRTIIKMAAQDDQQDGPLAAGQWTHRAWP